MAAALALHRICRGGVVTVVVSSGVVDGGAVVVLEEAELDGTRRA